MQLAHNPETGEYLQLVGDSWQPAKVAKNDAGEVLLFNGSEWVPPPQTGQQAQQPTTTEPGEVGRGLGLGARGVVEGLAGAGDILAGPARYLMNKTNEALGGAPDYFKPMAQTAPEALDLPTPETDSEKLINAGIRGVSGTIPTLGIGMAMQAGRIAPSVAEALTALPWVQALSGGVGGASSELAAQGGAGPVGQIAAGMAGGATPIGAAVVPNALKTALAKSFVSPQKALAFRDVGYTPPTLGAVSDSGSVQSLEGSLRQLLPSAGVMKRAQESGSATLGNVVEDTAQKMAGGGAVPASLEEMGHIAAGGAKAAKEAFTGAAREFENTVYAPLGQLSAELNNVMGFIDEQAARFSPEVAKAYRQRMLRELGSVAADAEKKIVVGGTPVSAEELASQPYLARMAEEVPGELNVASLRDWRSVVGERMKQQGTATTGDATQGELRQLYGQATKDIEAALPPEDLQSVTDYNRWYSQNKQLQSDVEKTFFGNRDATATAKAVLTADADQLANLLKVVGPESFDKIRAGALREVSRGQEGFSPSYAQKALSGGRGGMQDPAREALFRGEESPVLKIARALAESKNAMNTSNTGGVNAAAQLLGMGAGGILNMPLTAASAAIPYGVSRAVTSPSFLESAMSRALGQVQGPPIGAMAAPMMQGATQQPDTFRELLNKHGIK